MTKHLRFLPLSIFKISGHSMLPFLKPEDFVLTLNWFLDFKVGDAVVFKIKDQLLVKKIQKINDYKYFVEGENLQDSLDGKKFGFINKEQIIGKVIFHFAL